MGRNHKSQIETQTSGFSLLEVLLSLMALTAIVAASFGLFTEGRKQAKTFSSKTDCTTLVNSIANQIKSYDNAMTIRNWATSVTTPPNSLMPAQDPYCNNVGGRTAVCDPFPMIALKADNTVDLNDLRTHLNIRGAYTWAQSLYNAEGLPICSQNGAGVPPGKAYTPAQIGDVLPKIFPMPNWVDHVNLYIHEMKTACGTAVTNRSSEFSVQVAVTYREQSNPGVDQSCNSSINLKLPIDNQAPAVQVTRAYNGWNEDIQNGYCTDRRTFPAAADPRYQQMKFDYEINEPGSLLLTRSDSSWNFTPITTPPKYFNGPDTPMAGAGSITPDAGTVTYNQKVQGTLTFSNVPDRGGLDQHPNSLYAYSFSSVDTGGNTSTNTASKSFYTHTPTCKYDPVLYCPNASPADPHDAACASCTGVPNPNCEECWDTTGDKDTQPYDNCLNGLCPQGQRPPVCDPSIAPFVCVGTNYQDDCGLDRCPGSKPPSCPPGPYSNYACGDIVPGECVNNCGTGTGVNETGLNTADYDCDCVIKDACNNDTTLRGTGGNGAAILCPPAPPGNLGVHKPGCNCDGIDYNTIACGTAVPDICALPGDVTPDSCGLGQMGCSPCAPTPVIAAAPCNELPITGNYWECNDHQNWGDTTCNMPANDILIPASSCKTYTLTITPRGHRHGGSSLKYAMNWNGGWYWISKSDNAIGPSSCGGCHPMLNLLPGLPAVTRVFKPPVNGTQIWMRLYIYDIHDAGMRLYWTLTPSNP